MSPPVLSSETALLLLVDVQEAFLENMRRDRGPLLSRMKQLLLYADIFDLPLIATFEFPLEKKGEVPGELHDCFPNHAKRYVKKHFNACLEEDFLDLLKAEGRGQIVVAGSETDVCVLLTCLGLKGEGYEVFLLEDLLFSSTDKVGVALERMHRSGIIPLTLKTLFYELTRCVDKACWPKPWCEKYEALKDQLLEAEAL
jgi:nicotinamidase-related amidase